MVIDSRERVLLVRHSYVPGWHMPGGGVDTGETIAAAAARELFEETNVRLAGELKLHGVFYNKQGSKRDHVALFIVRNFTQERPPQPNDEIVAHGFFSFDQLPPNTSKATSARIAEVFHGAAINQMW